MNRLRCGWRVRTAASQQDACSFLCVFTCFCHLSTRRSRWAAMWCVSGKCNTNWTMPRREPTSQRQPPTNCGFEPVNRPARSSWWVHPSIHLSIFLQINFCSVKLYADDSVFSLCFRLLSEALLSSSCFVVMFDSSCMRSVWGALLKFDFSVYFSNGEKLTQIVMCIKITVLLWVLTALRLYSQDTILIL